MAPGSQETLSALSDPPKRPPLLWDPLPEEVVNHVPRIPFDLDEDRSGKNLRSAKRGAAAISAFFLLDVREAVTGQLRVGRLTALRKPDGGVLGIVAGDVIRRLVSRTIAQQIGKAVERATAPHQYALSTRAGSECIAHVLQGLCESPLTGWALSTRFLGRPCWTGCSTWHIVAVLPFVRMFYGAPSSYLCEDSAGTVHTIRQGEGGEQGDALMPLLFAVGQHSVLDAVQEEPRARGVVGVP